MLKHRTNKTLLLLFGFLFSSEILLAQDIYPLHPSIGDTIDVIEKLDYSLFPFIENDGFLIGTIHFEEDNFIFKSTFNDTIIERVLSKEEIIEAQQNIEKINSYYRLLAKEKREEDSVKVKLNRPTGKEPVYFSQEMSDQIKKQARMNLRLKEDARRMQEHQKGIQPNQLRIEFK